MGIFKKLTCKHTRAMYYEQRIERVLKNNSTEYESKIVRTIICPDCGMKLDAFKADRVGINSIMLARRYKERKQKKHELHT